MNVKRHLEEYMAQRGYQRVDDEVTPDKQEAEAQLENEVSKLLAEKERLTPKTADKQE